MLTKLFEEIRVTKLIDEHCAQLPIVYSSSSNSGGSGKNSNNSNRKSIFRFVKRKSFTQQNSSNSNSNSSSSSSSNTYNNTFNNNLNTTTNSTYQCSTGVQGILKNSSSYGDLSKLNEISQQNNKQTSNNTHNNHNTNTQNNSSSSTINTTNTDTTNTTTTPTVNTTTHHNTNKHKINDILKPLSHIILACQMESQYLSDFVKSELYLDFGTNCVSIWQLILHWRGEKKEKISEQFDLHFKNWTPRKQIEPLVTLTYLNKIKHVAFLK